MNVEKEWFESVAKSNFEQVFSDYKFTDTPYRMLQIGAYTGDATKWLAENIMSRFTNSELHDVDTWEGSPEPEHEKLNWSIVERAYDEKISKLVVKDRIFKHKTSSDQFFSGLGDKTKFDFIYVDGHHFAEYVARDAFNAFKHLNPNGIIAFDDYEYGKMLEPFAKPTPAIDFFLLAFENQLNVILSNYQIWIQKN
jgi:predicted O-methyltransferase YrrM